MEKIFKGAISLLMAGVISVFIVIACFIIFLAVSGIGSSYESLSPIVSIASALWVVLLIFISKVIYKKIGFDNKIEPNIYAETERNNNKSIIKTGVSRLGEVLFWIFFFGACIFAVLLFGFSHYDGASSPGSDSLWNFSPIFIFIAAFVFRIGSVVSRNRDKK